eukprot:TRINITY_DN1545_c1_g1_i3.p1 TRINITY_DN1545_c1_g1~~TRINITY_DN1545_c1_g1_i3.p1  ORF type:complete len:159 (-),score=30.22 TRINITY_DN1545_c1_g1_i3:128-604(-)
MHQRTPQLVRFPQRLLWPFLILNGVITGFMVTIIIIFHVQTESREGNPLYESTILVIVIINGLIAISASIYGGSLSKQLQASGAQKRVFTATIVFSVAFLIRVAFWLYRPITGEFLPYPLFFFFGYMIPELAPAVYQLYLMKGTEEMVASITGNSTAM